MEAAELLRIGWQRAVREWVSQVNPDVTDLVVEFFGRAFKPITYPEQARFGVHPTRISLCVGNVWLAGLHRRWEIFLLVDEPFQKPEFEFALVLSTERYIPLYWLKGAPESIVEILRSQEIWDSYANACVKVLASPISRNNIPRNQIHKVKLSNLEIGTAG